MSDNKEPIVLIGGTGLLGPSTVSELEDMGREVICVNRSGVNPSGGDAVRADRDSFDELKRVFGRFDSFTLIDMIPFTARQAALLTEALAGKQPAFTAVSSIDVYQAYNVLHRHDESAHAVQDTPLFEYSALRERLSFQGVAYDKLNVERIYSAYFNGVSALRLPAIYGLPDTSRVERYVEALRLSSHVELNPGYAQWRFSRSLNTNCAYAIALAAASKRAGVYNVAEEEHYTEAQWCSLIAQHMGIEPTIVLDEAEPVPMGIDTRQHWIVDSAKIREELGFTEKYCIREGLQAAVEAA
ncbi:MAG: hypothetical protein AAGI11_06985 [Pseudomonadota bacterium]